MPRFHTRRVMFAVATALVAILCANPSVIGVLASDYSSSLRTRLGSASRSLQFAAFNDWTLASVASTHFYTHSNATNRRGVFETLSSDDAPSAFLDASWTEMASALAMESPMSGLSHYSTAVSSFFSANTSTPQSFAQAAFASRVTHDRWGGWNAKTLAATSLPAYPHPEQGILTVPLSATRSATVFYHLNHDLFSPSYTEERQAWIGGKRMPHLDQAIPVTGPAVGAAGRRCFYMGKVIAVDDISHKQAEELTAHDVHTGDSGHAHEHEHLHGHAHSHGHTHVPGSAPSTITTLPSADARFATLAAAEAAPELSGSFVAIDTCTGGFSGTIGVDGEEFGIKPALTVLARRDIIRAMAAHEQDQLRARAGKPAAEPLSSSSSDSDVAAAEADYEVTVGSLHVVYSLASYADATAPHGAGSSCGVSHDEEAADIEAEVAAEAAAAAASSYARESGGHSDHSHARPPAGVDAADLARRRLRLHRRHTPHHGKGSFDATRKAIEARLAAESNGGQMKTLAAPSRVYVELLMASDRRRVLITGDATEYEAAAIANNIAAIYTTTPFVTPVDVVLVAQVAFVVEDPWGELQRGTCRECGPDEISVDELLTLWHRYRANSAVAPPHDNGHLLSGYDFQGPVLGYAGVAVQCITGHAGGVNQARATHTTEFVSTVVAHELGHNFGMLHDSQGNNCPASGFVMNAIVGSNPPKIFSDCSIRYYNAYVDDTLTCLLNRPTKRWGQDAICGNGFLEEGETCDCGQADCSDIDPCCNGATCQLKQGAKCSSIDACCDNNCQIRPKSASFLCRPALSSCDLPEVCDGESPRCPTDRVIGPGHPCETTLGDRGVCYAGACSSHVQTCRAAGSSFPNAPYAACPSQSRLNGGSLCGTLYCRASNAAPGACTYFSSSGVARSTDTGMSCGVGRQCMGTECVSSNDLATAFVWNAQSWQPCEKCGDEQTRTVRCVHSASDETVPEGMEHLCPPLGSLSVLVRPCQNETLQCVYARDMGADVKFFTVEMPQLIFVAACIGAVVLFFLVISLCYRAVSKPEKGGIKNMQDRDRRQKAASASAPQPKQGQGSQQSQQQSSQQFLKPPQQQQSRGV